MRIYIKDKKHLREVLKYTDTLFVEPHHKLTIKQKKDSIIYAWTYWNFTIEDNSILFTDVCSVACRIKDKTIYYEISYHEYIRILNDSKDKD